MCGDVDPQAVRDVLDGALAAWPSGAPFTPTPPRFPERAARVATFPADRQQRIKAYQEVAGGHSNPWARAFALQELVQENDPSALELARRALDSGDPVLRPVALEAMGATGGNQAAREIETVLRKNPEDPEDAVRGLFEVSTVQALELALHNEIRGRDFYAQVASSSSDPAVQEAAAEMAAEEDTHVTMLREWMAREACSVETRLPDLDPPNTPE